MGQPLFTVPPLFVRVPFEFVFCLSLICQVASSLAVLGRALLSLFCSCVFSRGAVASRLSHGPGCTAVSSAGAVQLCFLQFSLERPSAAKPAHMVRCADFLYCSGIWPTRWESGLVWNIQMPSRASGPLRRTCWDDDA